MVGTASFSLEMANMRPFGQGMISWRGMSQTIIQLLACVSILFSFVAGPTFAQDISGVPRIVDGDTIAIGEVKIRLEGIDAPESDQVCLDAQVARWSCGNEATKQLSDHVADRPIVCTPTGQDVYKRVLAICHLGTEDLNAWMVRQGWALAFVKYSRLYVNDEENARNARRGLWSGAFIAPWDWRHRDRQTIVLGALSVPITAQSLLLAPASSAGAPSAQCLIKGNVNRKGERIYHLPGSVHYAQVNMNGNEKRWFCTEDQAKAAGWRPALR
jgi:endonuclease YncB( thermonuclease family)